MSELSGALTDFPLRQVLRLVASGTKSGILVVTGESVRGSIFFKEGRVIFATTRSGPPQERDDTPDRRRPTEADEARILTSVVMRLLRLHDGAFVFQSGVEPMHPTIGNLAVETVIEQAEELISVWDGIEDAIGSLHQPYALRPGHDTDQITLTPRQWNVLAGLGAGTSAADVASDAALAEFDVASTMAELIDRKLIMPVERPPVGPAAADAESDPTPEPAEITVTAVVDRAEAVGEPTLAERYEYYVNSRGSELREPPPEVSGIVLDLTDNSVDRVHSPASTKESEPEPASELARRWRDLQRGNLPIDDE